MRNYFKKLCITTFLIIYIFIIVSILLTIKCNAIDRVNSQYKYLMLKENGFLLIYKTNQLNFPYYVIEFDVSLLPAHDQEELKEGILILDTMELKRIIEDYTG